MRRGAHSGERSVAHRAEAVRLLLQVSSEVSLGVQLDAQLGHLRSGAIRMAREQLDAKLLPRLVRARARVRGRVRVRVGVRVRVRVTVRLRASTSSPRVPTTPSVRRLPPGKG